ncbi:MAG: cytosine permease [Coriobacteriales bacterium]|nr:cytosine permease [Coriobacteriales bacterium]MBQ6586628.1 cytosine permease [Coriobacteriales bacterium]
MGKHDDFIRNETIFGIVPLVKGDRKYSFNDCFLVTSGFAIATWCYTQGAYSAGLVNFNQMLISIFGISFFFILLEMLPLWFSTRYGIDLWIWLRGALGKTGVAVMAFLCPVMNFGWYAVTADLFRDSLVQLFGVFGITLPAVIVPFLGVICVLLGVLIALGGPDVIKWSSRIMVVSLLIVGVIVIGICFSMAPADIMAIQPDLSAYKSPVEAFALSNEGMVAFAFSWSTQAYILPRLCRSERDAYWSTSAAYGFIAPLFVFIGGIMALVMFATVGEYIADPTTMLATLCGPAVSLLALIMVAFANIGTMGNGLYVNDMVIKSAIPRIPYRTLVIVMAILISGLTIWGGVSDNFGAFISIAAYLQGPINGIILVDCFILRKRRISLKSAYFLEGHDAYKYPGGVNIIGAISIVVGLICGLLLFNPMTGVVHSPLFYITTGSGFTLLTGGLTYLILTMTPWGKQYSLRDRDDLEIV